MELLRRVQNYVCKDGQTIKQKVEADYLGYECFWGVKGATVSFWNGVRNVNNPNEYRGASIHHWKIIDNMIVATNMNSMKATQELAVMHIVYK